MVVCCNPLNDKYFIAVNWGTTHLRAYLCQSTAHGLLLIDQRVGPGVVKVACGFEQSLFACIAPWRAKYGVLPVYLTGQITSSIGWQETPYLACPLSLKQIIDASVSLTVQDHPLTFLAGTQCSLQNNLQDVMRGEELQIAGFLQQHQQYQQGRVLICLPGTHTKWVLLENGEIQCFKTAMTGELFDLLCHQSVLIQAANCDGEFDWSAFEQGCQLTLDSDSGNFVHGVFSVRTMQLSGALNSLQARAYLSGVLVGSDVRAARYAKEWQLNNTTQVVVVGTEQLRRCFTLALSRIGVTCQDYPIQEATLSGFNYLSQLLQQAVNATHPA